MSQHDFTISNASGAAVRADVNDALQALASNNSGASAPSTTFPCQFWPDTANNLLKMRTVANGAWITVGTLDTAYLGLGQVRAGYLYGLTLSNNGSDATNDIDVAVGEASSDNAAMADRVLMALASGITKRLDASWAVGTNQGGLDTGSIGNATYHVFLIQRPDTGVVDVLFSTSATAPSMPTNYTKKRRIGSIIRVSGAIMAFVQTGDEFMHKTTPALDVQAAPPASTNAINRTLTVPSGIPVLAIVNVTLGGHAANTTVLLSALSQADVASSSYFSSVMQAYAGGSYSSAQVRVRTDTAATIRTRVSATDANTLLYISTHGWIDDRGRV